MLYEHSYGIIPLEQRDGLWYVFLVQHGKAKYWGFPKGHPSDGETPQQTAERELFEETGLKVVKYLDEKMVSTHYQFQHGEEKVDKTNSYFFAIVAGVVRIQVAEVSGDQWVSLSEALDVLTYPQDKELISYFPRIP